MIGVPSLSLKELHEAEPDEVLRRVLAVFAPRPPSCKRSGIGPSQKNAAAPNGRPPKSERIITTICTRVQKRYSGSLRSGHQRLSGTSPPCHNQRRCAHQKPPIQGLEMSSGVSTRE